MLHLDNYFEKHPVVISIYQLLFTITWKACGTRIGSYYTY